MADSQSQTWEEMQMEADSTKSTKESPIKTPKSKSSVEDEERITSDTEPEHEPLPAKEKHRHQSMESARTKGIREVPSSKAPVSRSSSNEGKSEAEDDPEDDEDEDFTNADVLPKSAIYHASSEVDRAHLFLEPEAFLKWMNESKQTKHHGRLPLPELSYRKSGSVGAHKMWLSGAFGSDKLTFPTTDYTIGIVLYPKDLVHKTFIKPVKKSSKKGELPELVPLSQKELDLIDKKRFLDMKIYSEEQSLALYEVKQENGNKGLRSLVTPEMEEDFATRFIECTPFQRGIFDVWFQKGGERYSFVLLDTRGEERIARNINISIFAEKKKAKKSKNAASRILNWQYKPCVTLVIQGKNGAKAKVYSTTFRLEHATKKSINIPISGGANFNKIFESLLKTVGGSNHEGFEIRARPMSRDKDDNSENTFHDPYTGNWHNWESLHSVVNITDPKSGSKVPVWVPIKMLVPSAYRVPWVAKNGAGKSGKSSKSKDAFLELGAETDAEVDMTDFENEGNETVMVPAVNVSSRDSKKSKDSKRSSKKERSIHYERSDDDEPPRKHRNDVDEDEEETRPNKKSMKKSKEDDAKASKSSKKSDDKEKKKKSKKDKKEKSSKKSKSSKSKEPELSEESSSSDDSDNEPLSEHEVNVPSKPIKSAFKPPKQNK